MTELRLALALVGLVLVVAVALISYDKFRIKRILRRREEIDAGTGGAREPHLGALEEPEIPAEDDDRIILLGVRDEVTVGSPRARLKADLEELEHDIDQPVQMELPEREQLPEARPDERIDFVASISGENAVQRDSVLGIYRQHEYLLERPHRIYGYRTAGRVWRNLEGEPAGESYGDIALAIQLVDGKGPVAEAELNRFAQLGLRLADSLERPLKFSQSFEEALARAREIEKFCEKFDLLAIINIMARGADGFAGRDIERAAVAEGMQLGSMNIFHMKSSGKDGDSNIFSMANMYKPGEFRPEDLDTLHTGGLTLFMNVPCTRDPVRAFRQMTETAQRLCDQLDGELRDSQHKSLSVDQLKDISRVIEKSVAGMNKAGIEPGSPLALRLF